MWTRRRTLIGGRFADGDFVIMRNGQEVGRVHPSPATGVDPYTWYTWTYPCTQGHARDLEDALHHAREAIRSLWADETPVVPRGSPERET
jgi:hypothetical protein